MTKSDALDNRFAQVIIKHFDYKFEVFTESIETIIDNKLKPIDLRLKSVESDVKVIKKVVTSQSKDLKDCDKRIAALEIAKG